MLAMEDARGAEDCIINWQCPIFIARSYAVKPNRSL
jgi:hypothetical protein